MGETPKQRSGMEAAQHDGTWREARVHREPVRGGPERARTERAHAAHARPGRGAGVRMGDAWLAAAARFVAGAAVVGAAFIGTVATGGGGCTRSGHAEAHVDVPVDPARRPARPMSHHGAGWLERDDRVAEEAPERMHDALGLRPGMVVADIGTGVGYHAIAIAPRVAPEGRVIGTEIQPEYRERFEERARNAGVENVEFVVTSPTETGLAPASVDLVLFVDVYHEIAEPEAFLRALRPALRPGGRLALVEFRAEDPNVPILPDHKMSVAQVDFELERAGYARVGRFDELPWQHLLFYAPNDEPSTSDGAGEGTGAGAGVTP